MKYLFSFFLLSASLTKLHAQITYSHYLDSTVQWSHEFNTGSVDFSYYEFDHYKVNGDTLIGGNYYWNIYHNGYGNYTTYNGTTTTPFPLAPRMGLREDSMKRFYIYNYYAANPHDSLWFDFNMHVGDTMLVNTSYPTIIGSVDSFQFDGFKHYRWSSAYCCYAIAEGMEYTYFGFPNSYLVCWQKDTALYQGGTCNYTGIADPSTRNSINVFPNPSHESMVVQSGAAGGMHVQITDAQGRMVQSADAPGNTAAFSIADLPAGIYFVRVMSGGGAVGMGKVVKE